MGFFALMVSQYCDCGRVGSFAAFVEPGAQARSLGSYLSKLDEPCMGWPRGWSSQVDPSYYATHAQNLEEGAWPGMICCGLCYVTSHKFDPFTDKRTILTRI